MTGIFVRVQRDGVWQNLEVDNLTDRELDEFITGQMKGKHGFQSCHEDVKLPWNWVKTLAAFIRDHKERIDEE